MIDKYMIYMLCTVECYRDRPFKGLDGLMADQGLKLGRKRNPHSL